MPTYRYRCGGCGEEFEVWQSFTEDPLHTHDHGCGGELVKVLTPAGIVLKGPGFYRNDSRTGSGKRGGGSSDGGSSDGGSSDGGSSEGGSSEGAGTEKPAAKKDGDGGSTSSGGDTTASGSSSASHTTS